MAGFRNLPFEGATVDGLNWTLTKPLEYQARSGNVYRVIIGATTDGPSIPKKLWSVKDPFGPAWLAGVLHDGAYRDTLEIAGEDNQWHHVSLSKDLCDLLFKEALEVHGASLFDAEAYYLAVKEFGNKSFWEDRSASSPKQL